MLPSVDVCTSAVTCDRNFQLRRRNNSCWRWAMAFLWRCCQELGDVRSGSFAGIRADQLVSLRTACLGLTQHCSCSTRQQCYLDDLEFPPRLQDHVRISDIAGLSPSPSFDHTKLHNRRPRIALRVSIVHPSRFPTLYTTTSHTYEKCRLAKDLAKFTPEAWLPAAGLQLPALQLHVRLLQEMGSKADILL